MKVIPPEILKIRDRLHRALYRSVKNLGEKITDDNFAEVKRRQLRILKHAIKLGWVAPDFLE